MDKRRVVISGIGLVTPLGLGQSKNWNDLISGESGINSLNSFDASDLSCRIGGEIPSGPSIEGKLNLNEWLNVKEQRKLDRFIMLGLVAADEAIKDSDIEISNEEVSKKTGVIVGSGIGGLKTISETSILLEEKGPRRISPFFIPSSLINLISGQISIKYGFKGPNHSVVTACSTGSHAIGDAYRIISTCDADIMIAGGAEAARGEPAAGGHALAPDRRAPGRRGGACRRRAVLVPLLATRRDWPRRSHQAWPQKAPHVPAAPTLHVCARPQAAAYQPPTRSR